MRRLVMFGALMGALLVVGAAEAAAQSTGQRKDLGIRANAIEHDPVRNVVYAAVDDTDPTHPNRVVRLDPATGAVLNSVPVGTDPWALALSDDGSFLYVGFRGDGKVVRVALATFTVDLEIHLGMANPGDPFLARDIAVLPGAPASFAVGRSAGVFSAGGVAVYDGATLRPDTTPASDGARSLLFSADGSTLYGSDFSQKLHVIAIDGTGAHRTATATGFGGRLDARFGNRLFTRSGDVVDVGGPTPVLAGTLPSDAGLSAVDRHPTAAKVVTAGKVAGPRTLLVEEFDPATLARSRRIDLGREWPDLPNQIVATPADTFFISFHEGAEPASLHLITPGGAIAGTVTDRHTGVGIGGLCVDVSPFNGFPVVIAAETETAADGTFRVDVAPGTYEIVYYDCAGWDYAAEFFGVNRKEEVVVAPYGTADASMTLTTTDLTGLVDVTQGEWHLSRPRQSIVHSFFFGNPGDVPMVGDWDCNGTDTPGLYRQSDGFVYLRNSNSQGIADIRFFFGNPGDLPLAGDFNGDGCDTVSIYRPSQSQVFVINKLGSDEGGLGAAEVDYFFGNPGDKPYVGDFDFDGIDTVGLHRESTGLVYFRNSHTQGPADEQFIFGDPGDRIVAGNFSGVWLETPAIFRPSERKFYIRHTNTQGNADRTDTWDFATDAWIPVAGTFGL